ncbi:hypothetical protein GF318_00135 [Candidatus Micrarchaeota archaeon]|nr:hypothetical protein [Candidatus Micrarchaeota archaeon]
MKALIAVFLLLLLFGCNGGEEPPPAEENITNETEEEKPPPVDIIIEGQENQTVEGNYTQEDEGPGENVSTGMEFIYDPNQTIGMYFMDLGETGLHGDAVLIKKGDLDILVDAGSSQKSGEVIDFLRSRKVDDIELLISTTADPTRYGGMKPVAKNFEIEELWWSGLSYGDLGYEDAISEVGKETKNTYEVREGHTAELNGITLEILNPPANDTFQDRDNDALVVRVSDRNFSALLTSNIKTGAQGELVNNKLEKIKTRIMEAPYYGTGRGTGSIGLFLIRAEPEVMIVTGSADDSAGNGGSREPFFRLLEQYEIPAYETYVNGSVRISSREEAYTVSYMEQN